jgi:flagellin-like hook-associated protein FlgL
MAELKGLGSQDPMKSSQDIASYDLEFHDLQRQLHDMSQMTFNGASLFANFSMSQAGTSTDSIFRDNSTNRTISIHTSTQGSQGTKISIHQAALLAALTMEIGDLDRATNAGANSTFSGKNNAAIKAAGTAATAGQVISFAAEDTNNTWDLDAVSMGAFQQALENISFLRAQVGGQMSRLSFAADTLSVQQTNIRAALGRIEDVDIAEESSNLSKYSILTQAAASMLTQANSTNDIALMLLR